MASKNPGSSKLSKTEPNSAVIENASDLSYASVSVDKNTEKSNLAVHSKKNMSSRDFSNMKVGLGSGVSGKSLEYEYSSADSEDDSGLFFSNISLGFSEEIQKTVGNIKEMTEMISQWRKFETLISDYLNKIK